MFFKSMYDFGVPSNGTHKDFIHETLKTGQV